MKKLLLVIVLCLMLSCISTYEIVYVTCKGSEQKQIELCITTQLRKDQKYVSYKKIDTGMYEVKVKSPSEWAK